jgi:hypothetical protein
MALEGALPESSEDQQYQAKVGWLRSQVVRKQKVMEKNKVNLAGSSPSRRNGPRFDDRLVIVDNSQFLFDTNGELINAQGGAADKAASAIKRGVFHAVQCVPPYKCEPGVLESHPVQPGDLPVVRRDFRKLAGLAA